MKFRLTHFLAIAFAIAAMSLPPAGAQAGIVATEDIAAQEAIEAQRERVREFMDRKDVEEQLVQMGVAADLARKRADALSNEEVVMIARKLDTLPAGGALRHNETVLLLLLIIVLLIAL